MASKQPTHGCSECESQGPITAVPSQVVHDYSGTSLYQDVPSTAGELFELDGYIQQGWVSTSSASVRNNHRWLGKLYPPWGYTTLLDTPNHGIPCKDRWAHGRSKKNRPLGGSHHQVVNLSTNELTTVNLFMTSMNQPLRPNQWTFCWQLVFLWNN